MQSVKKSGEARISYKEVKGVNTETVRYALKEAVHTICLRKEKYFPMFFYNSIVCLFKMRCCDQVTASVI